MKRNRKHAFRPTRAEKLACIRHVPSWPASDKAASLINNEVDLIALAVVVVATLFLVAADNEWRENDSTSFDRYAVQQMMAIRRFKGLAAELEAETMIDRIYSVERRRLFRLVSG